MTDAPAQALRCPFPHAVAEVERSRADVFVRRLLRVRERPVGASPASAVSAFRKSMMISTIRCTLTYLVFPFVLPALGLVTETGVILGMVIGVLAMTCDVFTIRRFFSVDHKWRWPFSTIAFCVICMLAVLLAQDIVHVVT
jgi:hypothetical protein